MPSESPLGIPEIVDVVALHLDQSSLARCLRVSKSWQDTFIPHVWREIRREFKDDGSWHQYAAPDQESLYKHRHLVQGLYISGPFKENDMCTHPNLRTLRISFYMGEKTTELSHRRVIDWELAGKAPSIRELSLACVIAEYPLFRGMSDNTHLRSLSIEQGEIRSNCALGLLEACKNLESLSLSRVLFEGEPVSIPHDAVFGRMRRLRLHEMWNNWDWVPMVFHCPMLESFEWTTRNFWLRISINHPVQKIHWPPIVHLNRSAGIRPYQDTDWASVIRGIGNTLGNITLFCPRMRDTFGPQAFEALLSHSNALVKLSLHSRSSATSAAILNVLHSCPKLEDLRVQEIMARDIVQGGPWVCRQLRSLMTCIRVGQTEQDLHHLVFERLSTLVCLTTLVIRYTINDDSGDGVLAFRLDCGLGQLATLRELASLDFQHYSSVIKTTQWLGMEDVKWMVENWKRLKNITGPFNEDPKVESQLRDIFKSHGIYVR
ncbi:MAG: hypothetical protein J3Q66DRAFT_125672 [Benniella sp.]|nr:MAG: hypothetical protein J3Q66DRAFT_125672 [Benniella sp.]